MDFLGGGPGSDTIYGGDGDDHVIGVQDDGDDFYWGQFGDDFLYAGGGDDTLNGGDGFDTVGVHFFGGSFSGYTITKNANGSITLTDNNPSDGDFDTGTDTLINVEAIQFDDGLYITATGTFTPSDSVI
jgi:hypothetical protein